MSVELSSIYSGGLTSHASNSESWKAASNVMNGGGSPPSPPPAPDYASANRAGIMTDVATLGTRKSVENAALFGGKVKNYGVEERTRDVAKSGYTFKNGKYYDSNGKQANANVASEKQTYYVQLYDESGKKLKKPAEVSEQQAFQTFDDSNSTISASEKLADWQRGQRDEEAQSLYDLGQKYGPKYIDMAKDFMERLDPEGTKNRKDLAADIGKQLEEYGADGPAIADITSAIAQEKIGNSPEFKNVADAEQYKQIGEAEKMERIEGKGPAFARGSMEDGGGKTNEIRSRLEQDIMDNLAAGEELTGSQTRAIERDTRAAQVSRGNYNGPAASAQEIASKYDFGTRMGQSRRAEALGLLSSGQSSYDTASRLRQEGNTLAQQELSNELTNIAQRNQASTVDYNNLLNQLNQNNQAIQANFGNSVTAAQFNNANAQQGFANDLAGVTQRNQANQQDYANQMAQLGFNNQNQQTRFSNELTAIGQRNAAKQQGIANRMAFAGLTPVGAVASTTAGASASPVPNTPSAQLMNMLNINPNAGSDAAKFALGVFDTQSKNYGSQLTYDAAAYAQNSPTAWISSIGGLGKLY